MRTTKCKDAIGKDNMVQCIHPQQHQLKTWCMVNHVSYFQMFIPLLVSIVVCIIPTIYIYIYICEHMRHTQKKRPKRTLKNDAKHAKLRHTSGGEERFLLFICFSVNFAVYSAINKNLPKTKLQNYF